MITKLSGEKNYIAFSFTVLIYFIYIRKLLIYIFEKLTAKIMFCDNLIHRFQ